MIHFLVLLLGVVAFALSDLHSTSAFFSMVLPLVCVASVMYALTLAVYLMRGKGLKRETQQDADMRFWVHMGTELKKASPKAPPPSAGSGPARSETPPAVSPSDQK